MFNISKEIDFATNLLTGPLRKSNLAKIFTSIQQTSDENFVQLIDHDFYTPSYGKPNAFIGTPIYQEGKKIGALMFELPIDRINEIMTFNKRWQDVGLGQTGETFLIGRDKTSFIESVMWKTSSISSRVKSSMSSMCRCCHIDVVRGFVITTGSFVCLVVLIAAP